MPELPEVETVAISLRPALIGKTIKSIWTSGMPLRTRITLESLQVLCGHQIRAIDRIGKYLIFRFAENLVFLSHLGMSGRYLLSSPGTPLLKHTHVLFSLQEDLELHYIDPRRFGAAVVYVAKEAAESVCIPELESLGPDPFHPVFTLDYLQERLHASKQSIKAFLLDQKNIAGLGNIYVLESLFQAGIHPARNCWSLTFKETQRLYQAILAILTEAMQQHGTTLSDRGYVDALGNQGQNQNLLKTYGRQGQPCFHCRAPIQRLVQQQRSTYFCPVCQR